MTGLPQGDPVRRSSGSRVERERRRRRRDRRWQAGVIAFALVVGAAVAFATSPRGLFGTAEPTETDNGPALVRQPLRTTLFVQTDPGGRVRFAMLAGVDPITERATVVFIPAETVIEVPALGLQPLTNLLKNDNADAITTNISNALGVRIDRTEVVSDALLTKLFATTPRINVTMTDATAVDDGAVSLAAGVNSIVSSLAARAVTGSEVGGALVHFATVQAVLAGWFDALRAAPKTAARAAKIGGASLVGLSGYGAALRFDTLPVASVAAGDVERFEVNESEAQALFSERFRAALFAPNGDRVRLELLNAVGTPGLVQRVANRLVPSGGYVVLTGNSVRFGETTTKVVYYRDTDAPNAQKFARLLRVGVVAKDPSTVSVVDITIVIGADLANQMKR